MSVDLELFHGPGENLSDRLLMAAQARALVDIVKDVQREVDVALEDSVTAVSEATGTAFTARGDGPVAGWSALITAPQPKPYISDRDAFVGWWVDEGLPHESREYVEVIDQERAVEMLTCDSPLLDAVASKLIGCLAVRTEVLLPDDAAEQATVTAHPTDDGGYVNPDTGEVIPGLSWRRAKPTLQVRGDGQAKARVRREVADRLGITPALAGGGR